MPIPYPGLFGGQISLQTRPACVFGLTHFSTATLTSKWLTDSESVPQAQPVKIFANRRKMLAFRDFSQAGWLKYDFKKPDQATPLN
jgi:hypothetical protein